MDREPRVLRGHEGTVSAVAFGPGGTLATASADGTARIWDAATGRAVRTIRPGSGALTALAFSPDGRLLATAGRDRKVNV